MSISFISRLTDAGINAIADSLATETPFNIDEWKLGSDANISLNGESTDVSGTVVDSGTVSELEFDIISNDRVILKVNLDESKGPYDFGNVGLFSNGIMVLHGTLSESIAKEPNGIGVVGNRIILNLTAIYSNVADAVDFSVIQGDFSSWPSVNTISDLPDANLAPFEGYIVRKDPSQNRPITAIRNENPENSGIFEWALDFHNKIVENPTDNDSENSFRIEGGVHTFRIASIDVLDIQRSGSTVLLDSNGQKLHINSSGGSISMSTNNASSKVNIGTVNGADDTAKFNVNAPVDANTDVAGFTNSTVGSSIKVTAVKTANSFINGTTSGDTVIRAMTNDLWITNANNTGGVYLGHNGNANVSMFGGSLLLNGNEGVGVTISEGGVPRLNISNGEMTLLNDTTFAYGGGALNDGTATDPSLYFVNDDSYGFYRNLNVEGFTLVKDGTERYTITPQGIHTPNNGTGSYIIGSTGVWDHLLRYSGSGVSTQLDIVGGYAESGQTGNTYGSLTFSYGEDSATYERMAFRFDAIRAIGSVQNDELHLKTIDLSGTEISSLVLLREGYLAAPQGIRVGNFTGWNSNGSALGDPRNTVTHIEGVGRLYKGTAVLTDQGYSDASWTKLPVGDITPYCRVPSGWTVEHILYGGESMLKVVHNLNIEAPLRNLNIMLSRQGNGVTRFGKSLAYAHGYDVNQGDTLGTDPLVVTGPDSVSNYFILYGTDNNNDQFEDIGVAVSFEVTVMS